MSIDQSSPNHRYMYPAQHISTSSIVDRWSLNLITMPPESQYSDYRTMLYSKCDTVVICFSVLDKNTFERARRIWLSEALKNGIPKTKILLLGMHKDEKPAQR